MTRKMLSQLCRSPAFSDLECTRGSATDIAPTFAAAKPANFGALLLAWAPAFYVNRGRIAALAQEAKLAILASVAWMKNGISASAATRGISANEVIQ